MAFVITNGSHYALYTDTGGIRKTTNINEAEVFPSINKAVTAIKKAPRKARSYYVCDINTKKICWRQNKRKSRRIQYSQSVREMIYKKADGRCELCGRKILYNNMTLDHIVPLAMGGEDAESNLQCTCKACNEFKGRILPEEFLDRISSIFMYQMEKKYASRLGWKVAAYILKRYLG